ncbi:ParB N-terminal domain-containing protein [Candidatus Mycobacterium wuenschmannii]|uniref:ParB N-terminal domain-containing protein n=1 Tax=Candidatus Mycobacterium wuenschmannii TaxID=3027808 RepID=A0ABY8W0N7_9MYCO|nr:ParB N-terminal domain-containing protein [Candidatus Mycobacterium wuenschmannii]WIM89449.1 ParB N-terminal domain-containing protein [Candidatus Mycobacterium wuenschmannii]
MAQLHESSARILGDADMTPGSLPGYGQLDPLSAVAVEEWVRRGSLLPVENIPLAAIRSSYTPRKNKANESHVQVLAQSPLPLPPIVIHRDSMRVIDGVHRLRATELRGDSTIAARLFEGNDAEAFALAVHLNVTHGLPLTLSERKAAAQKVLTSYPHWSDRSIGLIAGVSNKTVGKLRSCATEEISQLNPRLGRDGKVRPVSPAIGRRRAAEFLSMNPRASLREIARKAGVSVTTARDVRQRVHNGESPLPDNLAKRVGESGSPTVAAANDSALATPVVPPRVGARTMPEGRGRDLLQRLRNDPSVRSSERGRALLRLLSTVVVAISACNDFAEAVPTHCSGTFAEIARKNARAWQEIADKFEVNSH